MTTPPQDDLTAERAAQLYGSLTCTTYREGYQDPENDIALIAEELKTARQEALREAAQQARFGAMELRAINEPLQTDALGYGQKALQDFADILDRLASEGG